MKVKLRCFPILLIVLIGYIVYCNKNEALIDYTPQYKTNDSYEENNNTDTDSFYHDWYNNDTNDYDYRDDDQDDYYNDDYFNDSIPNRYDDNTTQATQGVFKKNALVIDIKKSSNKVNIYMFWGDGCPHCEEQFKFLESIKEEYGNYFNLYAFEVWHNEENRELMNQFASAMNETTRGVPYTIIGDESFSGFSKSSEDELLNAIKEKRLNNNDIYFDKIK